MMFVTKTAMLLWKLVQGIIRFQVFIEILIVAKWLHMKCLLHSRLFCLLCFMYSVCLASGQQRGKPAVLFSYNNASAGLSDAAGILSAHPLETLAIAGSRGTTIKVT